MSTTEKYHLLTIVNYHYETTHEHSQTTNSSPVITVVHQFYSTPKLKVVELFGGIGAIRRAFVKNNIDAVYDYVEINPSAVKAYNTLYNESFAPIDVKNYSLPWDVQVDVLMHGSPCQDFSVAGKNLGGLKDSGTRSSLLWETLRIIEEVNLQPRVVIWENVRNVLSGKHKPVFDAYLKYMEKLGYINTYKVINAKEKGIPQNRERIFVVSVYGQSSAFKFNDRVLPVKPITEFLRPFDDEMLYLRGLFIKWTLLIGKTKIIDVNYKKLTKSPLNLLCSTSDPKFNLQSKEYVDPQIWKKRYEDVEVDFYSVSSQKQNRYYLKFDSIFSTITTRLAGRYNPGVIKVPLTDEKHKEAQEKIKQWMKSKGLTDEKQNKTLDSQNHLILDYNGTNRVIITQNNQSYYLRNLSPWEQLLLMGFSDEDYQKLKHFGKTNLNTFAGNSIVVNVLQDIIKDLGDSGLLENNGKHFRGHH